MSKWKCGICNSEFDNYQAQGFNGIIYCPLCYFKELYKREKQENQEMKINTIPTLKHNIDALVDEVDELEDYKSRCEKAIEYIKEHIRIDDEYPDYMEMLIEERDDLLNILQNGSENDE